MTAEEFARLLNARKSGRNGWDAYCPAHPDHNASLHIAAGRRGVLVKCMSQGCAVKDIAEAVGLRLSDLFYDKQIKEERIEDMVKHLRAKYPKLRHRPNKKEKETLVATYLYTDRVGNLLAEKQRWTVKGEAGKMFMWRKPLPGGGWDWHILSDPPLYRLHELVRAKVVVLVEGEKDADNLSKLCSSHSMSVTTAPNGAESWVAEYGKDFAGKKVIIIPDQDAPGLAYAEQAAKDIAPHALCVRIVNLPVKDVSDYLADHTPAELKNLILGGIHDR